MPIYTEQLPDKLHELLGLALIDFKACQDDNKFRVCKGSWVRFDPDDWKQKGPCYVSFAGSVMVKTLGVLEHEPLRGAIDFRGNTGPWKYDQRTMDKLTAIDAMGEGSLRRAYSFCYDDHFNIPGTINDYPVCEYKWDRLKSWWASMRDIQQLLASKGV